MERRNFGGCNDNVHRGGCNRNCEMGDDNIMGKGWHSVEVEDNGWCPSVPVCHMTYCFCGQPLVLERCARIGFFAL